ncbi:DUF2752 domain-containing protein [Streptomyces marincola]|uniref:DUF2752 domain-containing protein n=1 Tax=Streptomyces marincola TaxID=2878388 RepID=UPI001CF38DB9|nr:DUF2752 domain-containing protein [Streptomyces marincola]UCM87326.1 DUF2752 domain-containing protein [Streptomyces marincola]
MPLRRSRSRPPRPPGRVPGAVLGPLAALAVAGAAFGYVAVVDPNEPGHYPACPLLSLTGLHCPGCGGLRSAHALAHGDPVGALRANALVAAGCAVAAALLAGRFAAAQRGGPAPGRGRPVLRRAHGLALGALVFAFTLVRNTPAGATLVP